MTGVRVGSIKGASAARGLWLSLGRLLPAVDTPGMDRWLFGGKVSGIEVGGTGAGFSFRGRFLLSLLALAGGAKLPTGGIF